MSAQRPANTPMPTDPAPSSGATALTGTRQSTPAASGLAAPETALGRGPGSGQGDSQGGSQGGFLSRWSRRKSQALGVPIRAGVQPPSSAQQLAPHLALNSALNSAPNLDTDLAQRAVTPVGLPPTPTERGCGATTDSDIEVIPASPATEPPAPTLEDVSRLTPQSDFGRFVRPGVDPAVKNAALKTLFSDPHFNLMDGLDTYIDDYGKPDPLPPGMLRQMAQSHFLRLFDDEPGVSAPAPVDPVDPLVHAGHVPRAQPTPPPPEPMGPIDENADLRLQPDDVDRCTGPAPGVIKDPGRES